jgi:hypothetical protein
MLGAMDVFLFPLRHEGPGLVLVEGQAAGLACVYSAMVPEEADIIGALMHRHSLGRCVSEWADAVLSAAGKTSVSKHDALLLVEKSPFNIDNPVARLAEVYSCPGV